MPVQVRDLFKPQLSQFRQLRLSTPVDESPLAVDAVVTGIRNEVDRRNTPSPAYPVEETEPLRMLSPEVTQTSPSQHMPVDLLNEPGHPFLDIDLRDFGDTVGALQLRSRPDSSIAAQRRSVEGHSFNRDATVRDNLVNDGGDRVDDVVLGVDEPSAIKLRKLGENRISGSDD